MKIIRSTKCSLKFASHSKLDQLRTVLVEYGRVVNVFIGAFWEECPAKGKLLKPVVDMPQTWLSARLRKVAAREAIDMIQAARKRFGNQAVRTAHQGRRMYVSSTIARLEPTTAASAFDAWLHLYSIGAGVILDLPIRYHKHWHKLAGKGKRLESFIITTNYVQFSFEIETGPKRTDGLLIGVDTGINALASLSDGRQYGTDPKPVIEAVKRCQQGSKRQQRLRRRLRQRMDEVATETVQGARLIVVEGLTKLNHQTKVRRRLTRTMRRALGSWAYRYWLQRLEQRCEDSRACFRRVPPQYTSQRCPACGHTERANRSGEMFQCQQCGHSDNADVNAARNVLERFASGPYGAAFQLA
jgi:putative transposase